MKFFAIAVACTIAPSAAMAQQTLYTDLNVGIGFLPEAAVDVEIDDGIDMFSGQVSADAESTVVFGGEIGMRGVGSRHISVGISGDYFEANAESLSAIGTLNGMAIDETVFLDELDLAGFDLDTEVLTLMGNVRYDIAGPNARFQPYIGVGGGVSFISDWDSATTLGVTAGIRIPLINSFYTGIRYRYLRLFDVADIDLGEGLSFTRGDSDVHLITLTFGASPTGSRR